MSQDLEILFEDKPTRCEKCGSMEIEFKGVGEYKCKNCGFLMYDDYGLVRNYIEQNPGATQTEVSMATGVTKSKIRQMLKDERIEIAPGSLVFLSCEICGKEIRSGRYCEKCSGVVSEQRKKSESTHNSNITGGFAKHKSDATGAKRFNR